MRARRWKGEGEGRGRRAGLVVAAAAMVLAGCANTRLPDGEVAGFGVQPGQQGIGPEGAAGAVPGAGNLATRPGAGNLATSGQPGAVSPGAGSGQVASGPQDSGSASGSVTGNQAQPSSRTGGSAPTGSTIGLTSSQITIQLSAPWSGYLGPIATQVYDNAFVPWMNEVNSGGGFGGRKIRFIKVDNQNTAEGAVAACKEAKSNGAFMVVNLLGATNESDCENDAKIPVLDTAPSYLKDWAYVLVPSYGPSQAPTQVSFMKSRFAQWGGKKIGIVYGSDVPQTVAMYNALRGELKRQGMNLVHSEAITTNQPSYVSQMSRMKSSGAEVVSLECFCLDAARIISDAQAIGYTPSYFGGVGPSTDVVSKAGGPAFNGMLSIRVNATEDSPAFQTYRGKVTKFGGDSKTADTNQMSYFGRLDALGQAFRLAANNLSRESLVASARTLVNYDRYGMIGAITWKNQQVGVSTYFPVSCCSTSYSWRRLGPAAKTFS